MRLIVKCGVKQQAMINKVGAAGIAIGIAISGTAATKFGIAN
jgi:hypothetical protein